jgi:4'-phosphopantetheinyl transferase
VARRALSQDEVQVWSASLAVESAASGRLAATLTEDEHRRADRFVFEQHRTRFVVARSFLRDVLAGFLDRAPASIRFRYEAAGKPRLDQHAGGDGAGLRFNLSHSGDIALLAVTRGRDVGVDLEVMRPVPDACTIAGRYFAPADSAALRALPETERDAAFLRCWTLKEAYVKAVGGGLAMPLDRFEVGCASEPELIRLRFLDENPEAGRWTLRALDLRPDAVGALAVEGQGWSVVRHQWSA